MLEQRNLIKGSYALRVYYVEEEPDVVRLLHSICADTIDLVYGMVPPMSVLCALMKLCIKTNRSDLCETHICRWVERWIKMSWNDMTAEVLEVSLLCGNRQLVAEACRALVLGNVAAEEVYRAESMMDGLPKLRA